MIENEHQRRITQSWVQRFGATLVAMYASKGDDVEPWVMQLSEDALRSQLETLQAELAEYDALTNYSAGRVVLT